MHCNAAYLRLIFTQRQYQTEKISKNSYWAHFMPYEHWYIYMVVNSHNIYPETIPEIILICYPCLSNPKRGTRVRAEYTFHVSPTTGGKWIWHLFAKSFFDLFSLFCLFSKTCAFWKHLHLQIKFLIRRHKWTRVFLWVASDFWQKTCKKEAKLLV